MRLNYILIPLVVFLTAFIGGRITSGGMAWYRTIKLPSWTPPGGVIGAVWTVLFILSAASALIVWNTAPHDGRFWAVVTLFLVNACANVFWSYLFFGVHHIYAAIWEAVFLCLTVLGLIWLIWPVSLVAALLLVPYAAWVAFASYLTYSVWLLNK
jgi:benzodiazapine receptor